MQYGNLTSIQQTLLALSQKSLIRKPTFVLWIEGFGDTTEYVMSIDTEIGFELLRGRGNINIGRAILELNNEKGYFYSNGSSMIKSYSRIKIWAGFNDLNIPIFTGLVYDAKPSGIQNTVIVNCRDYMGFFFDAIVKEGLDLFNTPKAIIENFCLNMGLLSEICENDENSASYSELNIKEQKMINALESICDSIFCIPYFDENGILRLSEREYSNFINWKFDDNNITDCNLLSDTEIINDVIVEYRNGFFSRHFDLVSINEYKSKSKQIRIPSLGQDFVSENLQGNIEELLEHSLEGFKFTSSNNSSIIDTIHIRMKSVEASGNISAKIYTDNNGIPGSPLGISRMKATGNIKNEFAWEMFCFDIPVKIAPSTNYWCILDTSLVISGNLYTQINNYSSTSKHVYYNTSWNTENNKKILHIIRGNKYALRLAEDIVRFYKKPHEKIKIIAPAIPQLQLFDEVNVDVKKMGIVGRYAIERRRHFLTTESYTTIDILRKVG